MGGATFPMAAVPQEETRNDAGGLVGLIFPPSIIAGAAIGGAGGGVWGLAGYEKIARHALSDEATATIVAEVEAE